jgi:hypothetical protein
MTAGTGGAAGGGAGGGGAGASAGSGGASAGGSSGAGAGGSGGAAGSAGSGGSGGSNDGWVPLFNGTNLDGWTPRGTSNPAALFAAQNGEIHVYPTQTDQSNQPEGNLVHATKLGGKYTLHVEYKWGDARFGDRKQRERDAGVLFHISGDSSKVWPDSMECQFGSSPLGADWVTGDLWVLGASMKAQTKGANGQLNTYSNFQKSTATAQKDLPKGEWNVVEIIVNGADEAIYMVNGTEVNRVLNMEYNDQPLTEGLVSVQAEYAEVFYRNIRYKKNL